MPSSNQQMRFITTSNYPTPTVAIKFALDAVLVTILLCVLSAASTTEVAANNGNKTASSTPERDLKNNACLKKLDSSDIVIASIAFKDGLNSSAQLKELVKRKPWGAGTPATSEEIQTQLDTQSPFLIITLTKKQALTLDNHRDIIRWVLVQSTSKSCE